jgi:hypothetical protein
VWNVASMSMRCMIGMCNRSAREWMLHWACILTYARHEQVIADLRSVWTSWQPCLDAWQNSFGSFGELRDRGHAGMDRLATLQRSARVPVRI